MSKKLPWKLYDRGIGWEIHGQDDQAINQGFRDTFSKDVAAFIVQACNAHHELLAACEAAEHILCVMEYTDHEGALAYDRLRAAIQQAKGE